MDSLLKMLATALSGQSGNKLVIKLESVPSDDEPKLRMLVTPELLPANEKAGSKVALYRAALRTPLVAVGTAESIEAELALHLENYVGKTSSIGESLQRMEESNRAAEQSTSSSDASPKKGTSQSSSAAAAAKQPTPTATSEDNGTTDILGDFENF